MKKLNNFLIVFLMLVSLSYQFEISIENGALGVWAIDNDIRILYTEKILIYDLASPNNLKTSKTLDHKLSLVNGILGGSKNLPAGKMVYYYDVEKQEFSYYTFPTLYVEFDKIIIENENVFWCYGTRMYYGKIETVADEFKIKTLGDFKVSDYECEKLFLGDISVYVKTEKELVSLDKVRLTYENNDNKFKWDSNPLISGDCTIINKKTPVCGGVIESSMVTINSGNGRIEKTFYIDSPIKKIQNHGNKVIVASEAGKLYGLNDLLIKEWEIEIPNYILRFENDDERIIFGNRNDYSVGTVDYDGNIKSHQSIYTTSSRKRLYPLDADSVWDTSTGNRVIVALVKSDGSMGDYTYIQAWSEESSCLIETLAVSATANVITGKVYPAINPEVYISGKPQKVERNENSWYIIQKFGQTNDVVIECRAGGQNTQTYLSVAESDRIKRKLYVEIPSDITEYTVFRVYNEYGLPIEEFDATLSVGQKEEIYSGKNGSVRIPIPLENARISFYAEGYERYPSTFISRTDNPGAMVNVIVGVLLFVIIIAIRKKIK
ncbi:hypothetical protein KO465_06695 [Candidatus Micrarchaeota archaeon]|nr:hypothetical protein [Candidatus Micrarchaeota archaeon]